MSVIKIGMACHKPSVLPKNSLFVPIQVGAALAAKRMDGMCHDDEGDNISKKNASYCELTAQYWLWKNQKADYYGLCHYRRFLCFAETDARKNERNQIEAYAIDDYNLKKYGLENEEQMRAVIESHDAVVGELQNVSRLYTPRGNQKTAWKHWTAHDRALIMKVDLQKMLDILDEVSPEIGADARECLQKKTFLGFNCFVLKREYFEELCAVEFEVLERLEKLVDLTHYNQQLKRIYGFMAEIISSAYIYHLEKKKKKVKHVPLVYFNYTDALPDYQPIEGDRVIPVLFMQENENAFKFATVWRSFLDHVDAEYTYDVLVCLEDVKLKQIYRKMAEKNENVSIRFIHAKHYQTMIKERAKDDACLLPLMPWILPAYKKMLIFGSNLLFKKSVVEMWTEELGEEDYLAAPYDVLMQARCNDIYEETEEKYLSRQVRDVYNYFNSDVMLLDFEKYRRMSVEEVFSARRNQEKQLRNAKEVMNVVCEGKCRILDQKWSVWMNESGYLKYQLPYAPNDLYQALLKAQKDPSVLVYLREEPWNPEGNTVDVDFWETAKRTPLYAKCIAYMQEELVSRRLNEKISLAKRLRLRLKDIAPKGIYCGAVFIKRLIFGPRKILLDFSQ